MGRVRILAAAVLILSFAMAPAPAGAGGKNFPESMKIRKWSHNGREWEVGWPGRSLKDNGISVTKEQLTDFVYWGFHHGLQTHYFLPMKESDPGVPFVFAPATKWEAVVLMPFGWTVYHINMNHQLREDMFPQLYKNPRPVKIGATMYSRKDWTNFFNISSTFGLFIFHKYMTIDPEKNLVKMEPPIGVSWVMSMEEAAMEMTHNPRVNDASIKEFYDLWNLYGKGFAQGDRRWEKKID